MDTSSRRGKGKRDLEGGESEYEGEGLVDTSGSINDSGGESGRKGVRKKRYGGGRSTPGLKEKAGGKRGERRARLI